MANPNPKTDHLKSWRPGQSGNPSGYSKDRRMTNELLRQLEAEGKLAGVVTALVREAQKGSFQHIREIFDRLDGKVASKVEVTENKIDWSALDNEGDTERPSASAKRAKSLPESGEA